MSNNANNLKLPDAQEIEQAKSTSRVLAKYSNEQIRMRLFDGPDSEGEDIILPGYALNILVDILTQISKGNAVSFVPVNAELTTQQAANLLNVSRPYLIKLLEDGKIKFRKVGAHRRILAQDILQYKEEEDKARLESLAELTAQAQELNMGYD